LRLLTCRISLERDPLDLLNLVTDRIPRTTFGTIEDDAAVKDTEPITAKSKLVS